MSVRERIHRLIDEIPEDRLPTVEIALALALAPIDDEPIEPNDETELENEWRDYVLGETLSAEEAKRQLLG